MLTADPLIDSKRLEALRLSGLMERPASDRMRHIAFSAVTLLGVDASEVNLLDGSLQHHYAGFPPQPDLPKFPAEDSGCVIVIRSNATVSIEDTALDPVTCNLPWTEHWGSYLGTPVRFMDQPVGSLCVLQRTARMWTRPDRLTLQGLADLASTLIAVERAG